MRRGAARRGSRGWSRPCQRAAARGGCGAGPGRGGRSGSGSPAREGQRVVPVSGGGDSGDRPAAPVSGQVNLGGQATPGPAQRLPTGPAPTIRVIRSRPLCPASAARRPPRAHRPVQHAGHRRRAGARAPPQNRPPPSSSRPPRRRQHGATPPESAPRCHHRTSGDAGCRRSSSARTALAGLATAHHTASARTPRSAPADDQPTGHRDADCDPATTAPTEPTPHPSDHDDQAPVRTTASTRSDPRDTP